MRARSPGARATVAARAGADAAPETIEINEELATDGAGVPELLAVAHADWAALSWLCWAVGLDRVELPDAATARAELAPAMKMFVRRTWRIKDRLASGSLIARSQGVPGFEWQGIDIDELPRHLAEMAAAEYVAVRVRCSSGWRAPTRCRRSRTTFAMSRHSGCRYVILLRLLRAAILMREEVAY